VSLTSQTLSSLVAIPPFEPAGGMGSPELPRTPVLPCESLSDKDSAGGESHHEQRLYFWV
jgi:hypothetical protein